MLLFTTNILTICTRFLEILEKSCAQTTRRLPRRLPADYPADYTPQTILRRTPRRVSADYAADYLRTTCRLPANPEEIPEHSGAKANVCLYILHLTAVLPRLMCQSTTATGQCGITSASPQRRSLLRKFDNLCFMLTYATHA